MNITLRKVMDECGRMEFPDYRIRSNSGGEWLLFVPNSKPAKICIEEGIETPSVRLAISNEAYYSSITLHSQDAIDIGLELIALGKTAQKHNYDSWQVSTLFDDLAKRNPFSVGEALSKIDETDNLTEALSMEKSK